MKYIALLRGVNVGGKNTVSMPRLKAVLQEHGFADVRTYINSGNILFSQEDADEVALQRECKALVEREFGLKIPVCVISADDLRSALEHAPDWWNQEAEAKHNAIFVIPPMSAEEVFERVGAAKPEYEKAAHHGQVIFWSAPIKTFSHTRWSKVVQTSAYDSITIRNANTTIKLSQLD